MENRLAGGALAPLWHLAVLLLFLGLSVAFYAPPARVGHGLVYYGQGSDPLAYIWFINWWPFALQHHLPLLYTQYADAPFGADLSWKACLPGLGLIAAPFTLAFGALAVSNALFLISPGLAGWGAYLAAVELTEDFAAALVAGLVFGFSSYMTGQMLGHLNLVFVIAVPLCLWAGIAAVKHGWGTVRLGLVLGALLAFQLGVSQEVFATLCMFGGFGFIAVFVLNPAMRAALRRLIPGGVLALGLGLLINAPLIWQMLLHYQGASGNIPPAHYFSSDLLSFILPTPTAWVGGGWFAPVSVRFPGNTSEQGAYLGLPLVVLLGAICRRHWSEPKFRVLGVMLVLACVLSLGPYVQVLGNEVSTAPWLLAFKLPFLKSMLPMRFMLYGWAAAAMFLALWLAGPGKKRWRYAALAACLLFLVPARGVTRNWTALAVPAVLTDGEIAPGSRVLVLPDFGNEMGFQYASGMRFLLVGQGYLGVGSPQPFARWALFRTLFNGEIEKIDRAAFAAYLAEYGVQDVVVTNTNYFDYSLPQRLDGAAEAAAAVQMLRASGWAVVSADADATLLRPARPMIPPSAAQLAVFMQAVAPAQDSAARATKLIKAETRRVCQIRAFARATGLPPAPLLAFYVRHVHPVLPASAIVCGAK
jgi:hypothetical protein